MAIHLKAIEQFFHVVLFIMLYKVLLTFKSVDDKTLVCDHSNKSYRALFGMLYKVCVWIRQGVLCLTIQMKPY